MVSVPFLRTRSRPHSRRYVAIRRTIEERCCFKGFQGWVVLARRMGQEYLSIRTFHLRRKAVPSSTSSAIPSANPSRRRDARVHYCRLASKLPHIEAEGPAIRLPRWELP